MNEREVIVIGCGIAGPAVALFLRRAGFSPRIYEAAPAPRDEEGAFFNLAPNGMHVLRALGAEPDVRRMGHRTLGLAFHNEAGKEIARLDGRRDEELFGAPSVLIPRGAVGRILRERAEREGIPVAFGKRLARIEEIPSGVRALFEDGTEATADLAIGCDGVHSRTRRFLFPDAPTPRFTGLLDTGGTSRRILANEDQVMRFVFGRRAFFGYFAAPDGTFWFSNVPWPREGDAPDPIAFEAWRDRLLELHRDDPPVVSEILREANAPLGRWKLYEMPMLPSWHRGRIVLLGDAAHAAPPHAGQGASLALEDALALARCLRDATAPQAAFVAFEALRRRRVARVLAQARHNGSPKAPRGPIARWMRDRMLPLFLRLGGRATRQTYAYRLTWDPVDVPARVGSDRRTEDATGGEANA